MEDKQTPMKTTNTTNADTTNMALFNSKWNFWQVLYLMLVVYILEFVVGWLKVPDSLGNIKGFINYLLTGFGEAFLFFVAIIIFLKLIHRPFSDLGLINITFKNFLLGLSGGLFLYVVVGFLGNLLIKYLGIPDPQSFAMVISGANEPWQFGLLLLLGGVIVPLKEELIFRGLIYSPLRKAYGRGKGIMLCALFFGIMHFDIIRFLPLFLGGVILTWLYEKTRSLWPSVIAHSVWNMLMIVMMWWQKG